MGGGKLPPRQKMIGMMYLVLTALLAMNVSKEVLNAFVVVNNALQKTNENFDSKNQRTYQDFQAALNKDKAKTQYYYDKAMEAKKTSDDLYSHIDKLKKHLIAITDKKEQAVADTLSLGGVESKDNYDEPTRILIGAEAATPISGEWTAMELQQKITDARNKFVNLFGDESKFLPGTKAAIESKIGLKTEDVQISPTEKENWISGNFYHLPLAAVITNLTKMQADVKNAEADVINELLKSVKGQDFTFDKLEAKVIAKSSYVVIGEEYEADVLLVASNSTTNPEIHFTTGALDTTNKQALEALNNPMEVIGGLGKYKLKPTTEGEQKWGGVIKVEKPGGGFEYYPFTSTYTAAKPALVVSPEKMNVLYTGVDNPVSISVPGIAAEKLQPSITGGTMTGAKGKYIVKVNKPGKATINVTVKGEDGKSKPVGQGFEFRVKRLPDPVAKFGGKKGSSDIPRSDLTTAAGVIAEMENFDFELKVSVTSFDVSALVDGLVRTESSNSNRLTQAQQQLIAKAAKPGGRVFIENVKAKMPDGVRDIPGVSLKVR